LLDHIIILRYVGRFIAADAVAAVAASGVYSGDCIVVVVVVVVTAATVVYASRADPPVSMQCSHAIGTCA